MSEKISLELWYDHTLNKNDGWKTRIWVRIYENGGGSLGGVAVHLYATTLSKPPREEELLIDVSGDYNNSELGMVTSRDNGETEPILVKRGRYNFWGGLLIEAVVYDPQFYKQSFWYVPLAKPADRDHDWAKCSWKSGFYKYCGNSDNGHGTPEVGWEIYRDSHKGVTSERFIGPPEEPWKASRMEKFEAAHNARIEKITGEVKNHLTVKTTQYNDDLLRHLSNMRSAAQEIETDFTKRAFAPFWDGICSFAVKMGHLEDYMRSMAQCYREHKEMCGQYLKIPYLREGCPQPSPFREEFLNPVDPNMLKQMTDWFRATTRKGQTDFQFASIYEHYRTRDVLVEGFRDLVNKFHDISCALNSVNRSVISGFRELRECVGELQECIGDEFEYLRGCIEEQERLARRVIEDQGRSIRQGIENEGRSTRQVMIASEVASELLRQKRHEELLASYEYEQNKIRQTLQDGFGDLRESIQDEALNAQELIEGVEDQKQERHRELLATYEHEQGAVREALNAALGRNEAGQQDRHDEVISEGKRDRELIKDIDKQVGGKEWWNY